MDITQLVALLGAIIAVFGSIGAVAKWAADKFTTLGRALDEMKTKYANLHGDYLLVQVRLERTRLAFQMVATELARKSPGNSALALAKSLLDEAFRPDPDLPRDMRDQLDEIDRVTAAQAE